MLLRTRILLPHNYLLLHVPMILLQAAHFEAAEVVLVHETFHGRGEGSDGRGDGNAGHDCFRAHLDFVHHGFGTRFGGVHDPLDFLVVDKVQQVRAATGDAEHGAGLDAFVVEKGRGSAGGVNLVAHVHEALDERHCLLLVFILEGDEDVAFGRDLVAGGELALEVSEVAVAIDAHDFAGGVVHFVYNLRARQMKIFFWAFPHIYVRSGYILGAIGCAYACRSPPRTKPRYASLGPKGSLSLTQMLGKNATSGFQ